MNWAITTLICIILVEFICRIPLVKIVSDINLVIRKSLKTLGSKFISDHWKEKAILAYSIILFSKTLQLALSILLIGLLAFLLVFLFECLDTDIGHFVISVPGSLYSILIASIYLLVRRHLV